LRRSHPFTPSKRAACDAALLAPKMWRIVLPLTPTNRFRNASKPSKKKSQRPESSIEKEKKLRPGVFKDLLKQQIIKRKIKEKRKPNQKRKKKN
jgi:hypothetical protein